jgi:hypothetical protein
MDMSKEGSVQTQELVWLEDSIGRATLQRRLMAKGPGEEAPILTSDSLAITRMLGDR